MYILPSEIYYSQNSINNYFDSKCVHANVRIGETLDKLCDGKLRINHIPNIRVVLRDGKYFTADNRRLWVFRHLERLGKCKEIPVRMTRNLNNGKKFTTRNGGTSVTVRGDPGGRWYLYSVHGDRGGQQLQQRRVHDSVGSGGGGGGSLGFGHILFALGAVTLIWIFLRK